MASALLHGDRSDVVSRGKKTPSPVVQSSKTPTPRGSATNKRLNSSDGASKQLVSAAKVPSSRCKSAAKQRPSDILNPKTVDPVSKPSPFLANTRTTFIISFVLCKICFGGLYGQICDQKMWLLIACRLELYLTAQFSRKVNKTLDLSGLPDLCCNFSLMTRHQSLHLPQVTQMVEYHVGKFKCSNFEGLLSFHGFHFCI